MSAAARRKAERAGYVPVHRVDVYLWGRHMGAVALDPRYGYYAFAYAPGFRSSGIEPAPLAMPTSDPAPRLFTELAVATWQRLPALLADALPDDFGNALINRWMAQHGVAASDITPLDRLAYMGSRAMGALQFRPRRGPGTRVPAALAMGKLVTVARQAVHGTIDDDDHAGAVLRQLIDVGTSAGGARAKAVIAWNRAAGEIRSGQLDAPPGFAHWLLKFDGMGPDHELGAAQEHGRIEYAYHLMARAAGIQMMDCALLEEGGRAHFATLRFDRGEGNARHHVQTLCALAHVDYRLRGTNGYEQLFDAIVRLGLPWEARAEAFRRMAFNVCARNCDDHSKNFSFRLREGHGWELAPAYDVTFAHNPRGAWTHQHLMSVNGRFDAITRADLLAVAERFGVGTAPALLDHVVATVARWREFAATAGVGEAMAAHVGGLHVVPH